MLPANLLIASLPHLPPSIYAFPAHFCSGEATGRLPPPRRRGWVPPAWRSARLATPGGPCSAFWSPPPAVLPTSAVPSLLGGLRRCSHFLHSPAPAFYTWVHFTACHYSHHPSAGSAWEVQHTLPARFTCCSTAVYHYLQPGLPAYLIMLHHTLLPSQLSAFCTFSLRLPRRTLPSSLCNCRTFLAVFPPLGGRAVLPASTKTEEDLLV